MNIFNSIQIDNMEAQNSAPATAPYSNVLKVIRTFQA